MERWELLLDELRAELVLREQELELLHEISLRLLDETFAKNIFDFIIPEARKLLEADHITILLRRSTFLEPMYSSIKSAIGQRVPIRESLAGLSLENNSTVNVADLSTDPRNMKYAPLRGYDGTEMRSLLTTPISIDDTAVGVLNAESKQPNAFKPVHERIAAAIGAQISIALQRTQTLASTALFADVDQLILAGGDSANPVDDSRHVTQIALQKVIAELQRLEHIEAHGAQILLVHGHNELSIVHSTNSSDVGLTVPIDNSICGRAARERKTVIVKNVSEDPEYRSLLGCSIKSEIAVPILYGENEDLVIGVLNVESAELDAFSEFYRLVLESFAQKARTILTFAKLRADVVEAMELRNADDLLVAVGDQTTHLIHRLNNTVGAMRAYIIGIQEDQEEGKLDHGTLKEELARLRTLSEQALKIPDGVARLLSLGGTPVDVNTCVTAAINLIGREHKIEVHLNLAEGIPTLSLYCFDIVVQNLIQNAIDAMPEGGQLSVSTSVAQHRELLTGYLQILISDTGTGISADILPRIFELNFTTKGARGKGLGLGLWWVRNFVRRAKGDITIKSEPGSGTEVTVKIPFSLEALH